MSLFDRPGLTAAFRDQDAVVNSRALAEAVGVRAWVTGPGRLASLLGDRTTSMTRSLRVRNSHFRAATDWAPRYRSVREGYRAMAAGLQTR
ncbi:MAG: hypothetical protein ABWY45_21555 [Mycobacterium sp.]